MSGYSFIEERDAMGISLRFQGPGLPVHHCGIRVMQPLNEWATKHATIEFARHEAGNILWLLERAREAGREDMRRELRTLLGVAGVERR